MSTHDPAEMNWQVCKAPVLSRELFGGLDSVILERLRTWLGDDGRKFFIGVYEKYGTLNAAWSDGTIPHAVHFREGMTVRNFLRLTMREIATENEIEFHEDSIALDDIWEPAVLRALGLTQEDEFGRSREETPGGEK